MWHNNGLSITLLVLFVATLIGQTLTGWHTENSDLNAHGRTPMELSMYLASGHFLEVTMENWESEFLQMFIYVVFTIFLFQRGSSESKDPDRPDEPEPTVSEKSPKSARATGLRHTLFANSMSLTFLGLFLITFFLHAVGGVVQYNEEQSLHGESAISLLTYMCSSRFWFESLQNWQSEFLSLLCMVVLSIFLRQRGSPESKPVTAPHAETGS